MRNLWKSAAVFAVLSVGAVCLTGCSGPSSEEVAKRFKIELFGAMNIEESDLTAENLKSWNKLADGMAKDALDGQCPNDAYRAGLGKDGAKDLVYAWDVTCSMYFEGQLSKSQIERNKQELIDRAVSGIGK